MFGCGLKYFSERLKLECVYKICAANELHKSSTKLFKTIHNSRNISPKEKIIVSK